MKLRKLLALTMALTLAATPMTAYAADNTSGGTIPGTGDDLSTEAGVNYANTTVYKVTLPTSSALAFALDPQGLSTLGDTEAGKVDDGSEGKIVSSAPWTVKNESSVDVTITGEFYLSDEDTTATLTTLSLADKAKIDNTKKQICMIIQDRTGSEGAYNYEDLGAVESVDVAEPSTASVNMEAAEYEFKESSGNFTYELKTGADNFSEKELVVGGVCASDYDWSAYTGASAKKLTLHATFSFAKKVADTYVMSKQADGSLTYTFVENAPVTGTISALTIDGTARQGMVTNNVVTYASGVFTIPASTVSQLFTTAGDHTIDVTIDGTTYNLTYTVAN